MPSRAVPIVLLGPQRFTRTLGEAVRATGIAGPLALVTAGWQEREGEDEVLREHLAAAGCAAENLRLYERTEELFEADPELAAAHRERQERLRHLQELYRLRLTHLKAAVRELDLREGPPELLAPERRHALEAVRALDAHHLRRVRALRRATDEATGLRRRPALLRQAAGVRRALERAAGVAIAGGHVAVLLNRLRLFGGSRLLRGRPLFAWSAGAMVVAERVVLFHDHPPQQSGDAELLDAGLGLCHGILPLPHARRRLRLGEPRRVALFAERFAPAAALAFDDGARLTVAEGGWRAGPGVFRLTPEGRVEPAGELP